MIQSGKVSCTQFKSPTDPTEMLLLTLAAGDYFGEMALMLEEARAANCIAFGGKVIDYPCAASFFCCFFICCFCCCCFCFRCFVLFLFFFCFVRTFRLLHVLPLFYSYVFSPTVHLVRTGMLFEHPPLWIRVTPRFIFCFFSPLVMSAHPLFNLVPVRFFF